MTNFLEKLLGLQTNQQNKTKDLERLHSYGNNLVRIPKSREYPEHLIAHGRISRNRRPPIDIRTAISKRENDIEFSTNLGQLPNTSLGAAIIERLNHLFDGKFVTFDNQEESSKMDLVYATRKPYEWLDRKRFEVELENHAKTKDLIVPLLSASTSIRQPKKPLDYPSIRKLAASTVDNNLRLSERLRNRLSSGQYLPVLHDEQEE